MKRFVSLMLVLLMVLVFSGCTAQQVQAPPADDTPEESATQPETQEEAPADTETEPEETPDETGAPELDTSELVTLVFYLCGDEPNDTAVVEDALNERMVEKFNTKLDFQFTTWTDYTTKYNNTLTTGGADLVYIAGWLNYHTLAASGAFLELDDLMNNYAPELRARAGEDTLNMCRVGGELYAVPNLWPEYVSTGISYRQDLVEKYSLPVPDSLENLGAYFQGIKDNDPDQPIYYGTADTNSVDCTGFDIAEALVIKYDGFMDYGYIFDADNPSVLTDYFWSDDFVEDCKLFKTWADAGYWTRSSLSNENNTDAYKNGLTTAIVSGQNPNKHITNMNDFANEHPDWETKYLAYGEVTGYICPSHATQNGTSIVRGCKYPERAMAVLQYLMMDEETNRLVQCGIEGTHYEIQDGLYVNLSEDYGYEAMDTWNLRVNEFKLPQGTDTILQEMFDYYATIGEKCKYPNVNIGGDFSEDYSAYEAERTAVVNVRAQYLPPLQAGFVDDVDAAVEEFRTKMLEAGLEKCREGYLAQWDAYCQEHDYV